MGWININVSCSHCYCYHYHHYWYHHYWWYSFLYHIHVFFSCASEAWALLCSPMKAIAWKPKTMSGLIPFWAHTLTLPASSCKRSMHRMAGGRLKYWEERGKVVEVSAEPASQLSSITTNSCWQLDSLEMQSNRLGNLILLLETQQTGRSCAPKSCGQVREGSSPWGGKASPGTGSTWRISMGITAMVLNPGRFYFSPAIWQWLVSVAITTKRVQDSTQGIGPGVHQTSTKESPQSKKILQPQMSIVPRLRNSWLETPNTYLKDL